MDQPLNNEWTVSDRYGVPNYSLELSDLNPCAVALDPWDNVLPDPIHWKEHRDREDETTHYTYNAGEYTLTVWND